MQISETKRMVRVQEWRDQIQEQQRSGLTVRKWCQTKGIGEGQYYYWLRVVREAVLDEIEKSGRNDTAIHLVEVHDLQTPAVSHEELPYPRPSGEKDCIRIQHGQTVIELPSYTNLSAVAELVEALIRS